MWGNRICKNIKIILLTLILVTNVNVEAQWLNSSIPENIIHSNFLFRANSGKVFSNVINMGLFSSTNFGDSWVNSSNGLNPEANITCMAETGSVIFAGSENSLYKSTSNGNNWIQVQIISSYNLPVSSLLINGNQIFAGTQNGIYVSTNEGVNWALNFQGYNNYKQIDRMANNGLSLFSLGSCGSTGKLYRSTNNGQSWDTIGSGLDFFGIHNMQCCGEKVYISSLTKYYISTNNGNNFTQYSGNCNLYNFLGKSDDFITSGRFGACMYIPLCGFYYTEITSGLAGLNVEDFIISYPDFLIATDKGFYKSTNAGINWFSSGIGTIPHRYTGVGTYGTLVFTSNSVTGKIFYKDLGGVWKAGYGSFGMNQYHKYINNYPYISAFTEDLILYSHVYANSWGIVNIPSLTPKRFDACENFKIASNANNIIYKSTNYSSNWSVLSSEGLPANIYKIHSLTIAPDNSVLLGIITNDMNYKLYKLNYNSSLWFEIIIINVPGFKTDIIKMLENNLFVASGFNVYISTNSGLNWSLNNLGLPCDTITDFAISDNKNFCSTRNYGVYKFSGNSWISYNNDLGNLKINAISGYFANLYAATDSGLYYADVYVGIEKVNEEQLKYSLFQNYPNPFNTNTTIKFFIPKTSNVKLSIFDITGKELEIPVNEQLSEGNYRINWNGQKFSSGVYFYGLKTNEYTEIKKMILLK